MAERVGGSAFALLLLFGGTGRAEETPAELCKLPAQSAAASSPQRLTRQRVNVAQSHIDRATRAYENERYADALSALRLAYALQPRPDLLFNLAQSCRELGQYAAALALFVQVDKEAAQPALREAAQRHATELQGLLVAQADEQGRQLLEAKKYAEAIAVWEGTFALVPRPILLFRIAQTERRRGNSEAALGAYEKFLRLDPESELKVEVSEYIRHLQAGMLDAEAQRSAAEQRFGQAIASWDSAYRLDPVPIYLYQRAEAERSAGLLRDALSSYERFLAADPQTPLRAELAVRRRQLQARLLEEEASRWWAQKSYAQAARVLAEAESLSPLPQHLFQRAEALRLAGQPEEARSLYRRYLEQEPRSEYRDLAEKSIAQIDAARERERRDDKLKKPQPLQKRWWLWTAVAAAVTAGVVVTAVVATQVTVAPSYPNLRIVHLQGALHEP